MAPVAAAAAAEAAEAARGGAEDLRFGTGSWFLSVQTTRGWDFRGCVRVYVCVCVHHFEHANSCETCKQYWCTFRQSSACRGPPCVPEGQRARRDEPTGYNSFKITPILVAIKSPTSTKTDEFAQRSLRQLAYRTPLEIFRFLLVLDKKGVTDDRRNGLQETHLKKAC